MFALKREEKNCLKRRTKIVLGQEAKVTKVEEGKGACGPHGGEVSR